MHRGLSADDHRWVALPGRDVPRDATAPLAALMLDAYRDTVDDEGETLADAEAVVAELFAGAFGAFDSHASSLVGPVSAPVAATLVTIQRDRPLISFSMTRPSAARQGHARRGLRHAFGVLSRSGWTEVRLVVTVANHAAMSLYAAEGFVVRPNDQAR